MRLILRSYNIGNRHDPYRAEERTAVVRRGLAVTYYHDGLGAQRLVVNGKVVLGTFDPEAKEVPDAFESFTGLSVDRFDRCYHRIHKNDIEDLMGPASRYI